MRPFLVALQFLTVIPLRFRQPPTSGQWGQSLLFYPLVGLAVGGLISWGAWVLELFSAPPLLAGAILLALWAGISGALHLDGLADSIDAWFAGRGDRARTMLILKDPHCGAMAMVAINLLLLLKFAALVVLSTRHQWQWLILPPVFGRWILLLLFLTSPYVREDGLGAAMARCLPRRWATVLALVWPAVLILVLQGAALVALCATLIIFFILRHLMMRRLGGTTGDTAGALVELSEAVSLCALCLFAPMSSM